MLQYNIAFARKMAEAADMVLQDDAQPLEAQQTVLYLSLLSCEITLKALLEAAGQPISEIKKRNHDLAGLLKDICACDISDALPGSPDTPMSAAKIIVIPLDPAFANATVGTILTASDAGATPYPSGIRYGTQMRHYPASLVLKCAQAVLGWADLHLTNIRKVRQ